MSAGGRVSGSGSCASPLRVALLAGAFLAACTEGGTSLLPGRGTADVGHADAEVIGADGGAPTDAAAEPRAALVAIPEALDLGGVGVNCAATGRGFVLHNAETPNVVVLGLTVEPAAFVASAMITFPARIERGESIDVGLQFQSPLLGEHSGFVRVDYTVDGARQRLQVDLRVEVVLGPTQVDEFDRLGTSEPPRFLLLNQPVISTLRVFVDDVELPRLNEAGAELWTYDYGTNSIRFAAKAEVPAGTRIRVEYSAQCL